MKLSRRTISAMLTVVLVLRARAVAMEQQGRGDTDSPDRSDEPTSQLRLLRIGDKMPDIGDRAKWLKGEPAKSFVREKIYVLDLWATWCRPCIAAIPHTSRIADLYARHDVTVIGIALDPGASTPTNEFVEKRSKDIRYSICEDIDAQLGREYMGRTGARGIPTALIVDRQGRLAWIGHPKNMSGPLAEITLGTYDIEGAIRQAMADTPELEEQEGGRAGRADVTALVDAIRKEDGDAVVRLAEKLLVNDGRKSPRRINNLSVKAKGLYFRGDVDAAHNLSRSLIDEDGHFKKQVLCGQAEFYAVRWNKNSPRNLRIAIELAEAAIACQGGQQWPHAEGTLAFVLDVVEQKYLRKLGADQLPETNYLRKKLTEYRKLRDSNPGTWPGTRDARAEIFGDRNAEQEVYPGLSP